MSRELTKEEIQALYDKEHANIGRFSALLSASCKYAWAGSLAIFFSSVVAASDETMVRFRPVFNFLWLAAFLGAMAFIFEIIQYVSAFLHAREFTSWLLEKKRLYLDELQTRSNSNFALINMILFALKLICATLSAIFVAIGMFLVSFQKL